MNNISSLYDQLDSASETLTALSYISNQKTAVSPGSLTNVSSLLSSAGLSLNLQPAANLLDCALTLEDRIMDKAQEKAMELLMSNSTSNQIVAAINQAASYAEVIQEIVNTIKSANPKDLLTELAIAKSLQGIQRIGKIQEILDTFGDSVANIEQFINDLDVLDLCGSTNYTVSGEMIPPQQTMPAIAPTASAPTYPSASINSSMIQINDDYDALMHDLRNFIAKDPTKTDEEEYRTMITSLNTITLAYHDKLMKSTTNEKDATFHAEFIDSIKIESDIHASKWSAETKNEFSTKSQGVSNVLKDSGDVIRAYAMRNNPGPASGSFLSKGITWYSNAYADYTTFLDLRESERPPDLIEHWRKKGRKVTGVRSGPLKLEWTRVGATGIKLISDYSCASTRVPIGSVLSMKNADGTPYNPSGKNPNGIYVVHDTGSLPNTYNKPDVYTDTPDLYNRSNMADVRTFLIKKGTVVNTPQYKLAQKRYGGGSI